MLNTSLDLSHHDLISPSYWSDDVSPSLTSNCWSKTSVSSHINMDDWLPYLKRLPRDPYVATRWKRMSWLYLDHQFNLRVLNGCPMAQGGSYNDAKTMADICRHYPPLEPHFLSRADVQQFVRAWAELWEIGPNEPILMQINGVKGFGPIDPLQGQGIHKDGSKYLSILVINRNNVKGAVNQLYTDKKGLNKILETELEPGEILHIRDNEIYHNVTGIEPKFPDKPWERFVIIINSAFDDKFQNRVLRQHFPEAVLYD